MSTDVSSLLPDGHSLASLAARSSRWLSEEVAASPWWGGWLAASECQGVADLVEARAEEITDAFSVLMDGRRQAGLPAEFRMQLHVFAQLARSVNDSTMCLRLFASA